MLEQQLDRLAQSGDVDRRLIVAAATTPIGIDHGNPGNFQALMIHRSTAMAVQTVEMLKYFIKHWRIRRSFSSDDLTEWTRLIRGLFDTLASNSISSPNELLRCAYSEECMPAIEMLCEQAKADPAFQMKLMQLTYGIGPLGEVAQIEDVATLRYLCQQDGIEAHASNRDDRGSNILGTLINPPIEIIELLLDKFPWLASERGGGDKALIRVIRYRKQTSDRVKAAKLLLQHVQATPGLVDVDELLAEAVRRGWPDMCRMLTVDGHTDVRKVIKRSSSGQFEFKEHCLKGRSFYREPDAKVMEAIIGCLSEEVLESITAAQETGSE